MRGGEGREGGREGGEMAQDRRVVHTCKDAASRPDVNGGGVDLSPHQDLWRSVPQCHYLWDVLRNWS